MVRPFAFAALFAVLAAHVVFTLGLVTVSTGVTDVLYLVVEVGAVLLTAARAVAVKRNRLAWALIAVGLAWWTVGDLCWTLSFNAMEVAPTRTCPTPSISPCTRCCMSRWRC